MDYKILKADITDVAEILEVQLAAYRVVAQWYGVYDIPPLLETIEDLAALFDTDTFMKAVVDRRLAGSVRAYEKNGTCFIGRLGVLPEFQGHGIGTSLMAAIEQQFDVCRYELFTGAEVAGNIALYEKLGYKIFKQTDYGCGDIKVVYMEKSV